MDLAAKATPKVVLADKEVLRAEPMDKEALEDRLVDHLPVKEVRMLERALKVAMVVVSADLSVLAPKVVSTVAPLLE